MCIFLSPLFAGNSESDRIAQSYYNDGILKFKAVLNAFQPLNDEQFSCKNYYLAILKDDIKETDKILKANYKQYPATYYGELSCLELAKIDFVKKDYPEALKNLEKVKLPEITEKYYWQLLIYNLNKQYEKAQISAGKYLELSDNKELKEIAYILLTEILIKLYKFEEAGVILDKMVQEGCLTDLVPAKLYNQGLISEGKGLTTEAINSYKVIMSDYPQDSYSFLAQDRLEILRKKVRSESKPVIPVNKEKPEISVKETNKIPDKYYLQAGAFATETNAQMHCVQINKFSYPTLTISKLINGNELRCVLVGPFDTKEEAKSAMQILKKQNIPAILLEN